MRAGALAAVGAVLLAAAYALTGGTGGPAPVVVFAASSLADALPRVGADWTARGNPTVQFAFDASSRLAAQIDAGAPADAFFSADTDWMDELDGRGRIDPATRMNLLGNSLVVIVPAQEAARVRTVADLGAPDVHRVALAGEGVPAGRYGRAALASLGAWAAIERRVVVADNVRMVLGWVARGEAQAGVVYASDARVEPRVRVALTFPPTSHPPIVYPMAVLRASARPALAADFLAYCASTEASRAFADAGFSPAGGVP